MRILKLAAVLMAISVGAGAEWRGAHVMAWGPAGGDEGLPALKRAIDEVLLPLGVNTLVYEVGYNFEFESHPDMRFAPYMTKAAARDLAEFCRARNLRLIPQFNCLGHQSWVKQNMIFPLMANHPEMEEVPDLPESERPKRLKSWCPLHPGVNAIVFDLLDEIADTFGADALHVGMDEVLTIASPKCPRCAGKSPAELFAKAVNDLHGHIVKERGRTMLMWGDRLLEAAPGTMGQGWEASDKGTAPAIDLVPKDIVICDWHYSVQPDYPSIRLFLEKGFRVWPASWKNTDAALAVIDCAYGQSHERMLGYLATSWVIQAGQFAEALLGEGDAQAQADRAMPAAESLKASMRRLQEKATPAPIDYALQLDTPLRHYDKEFLWFHPRAAAIPGLGEQGQPLVVMTLQRHLHVSDFYSGLHYMTSRDLGKTWTSPICPKELAWDERPNGEVIGVCDVTPGWHAAAGRLLAIGAQVRYKDGQQIYDTPQSRAGAYAVYDPTADTWSPWRRIEMPDPAGKFYGVTPGCVQWIIEPDGRILLPIYFNGPGAGRYSVTVLRCAFDGETLAYVEHGDEMSLDIERGLCEPSLAKLGKTYYLTIRNDQKGYVTSGMDGLHFAPIKPWTFDDGAELGSYNTQQHWLTHGNGLFLTYTRRGADNDHIMRHRAPLFMAQVDPARLCVMRATERALIPERGATMGNFGAAAIIENESWVTVSEGIWNEEALARGAEGATFIARIHWK